MDEPKIDTSEHWFSITFPRSGMGYRRDAQSQPESQPESLALRIARLLQSGPLAKSEISTGLGQKGISGQLNHVIRMLLHEELIEYTIPEKPTSRLQKYRLTDKGEILLKYGDGESTTHD